jgi:hypothetical protein
VEALDLAVGLRTVRASPLRLDGEFFAGVSPQVRPVGAPIVCKHPLNGDATIREPRDGAVQDAGGGDGGLVVVCLRVGDARVVVDDRCTKA